mmetsp:Transcript_23033/g.56287  ORF Transcript_23033/g.56287 Transcript_23033/m.56287 type:complete len:161 (-) Transcript_23033:111-593(-)
MAGAAGAAGGGPATQNLTVPQIEEWKRLFHLVDRDGDQHVDTSELGGLLRLFGVKPTPQELQQLTSQVDPQNRGYIDFPAFVNVLSSAMKTPGDELEEAFRAFDQKGTGFADANAMQHALTTMGDCMSAADVQELISLGGGADHSGNVQWAPIKSKLQTG